ncbi:ATP-binding protein [Legionella pneumophila serogroup 1]|uniref:AAA family ATPase n=1 Tax=Legionella pneumophila TaxID=446 RepID=UPI0007870622|nr:ATP-binding protein [Legionella pneumophila]MCZ4679689.1 ATP-binding protein [Legionella pneumophila]MCZ4749730.1 ATP-binding protein [Legionella pneumophila]HAT1994490.1 ATP-binding protein [Legionella pneumophila]HAT2052136.1 ATP-binding protein [Legionella pneumophila]HAT4435906.1 ATP-binding protein [Legionella pneumophila]
MLIEFNVSNFRSIYGKQTFSMVAGHGSELEENLITDASEGRIRLVRAAVIYGANASGKSNLLSALAFMRMFVNKSAKESQHGEMIPIDSFLFDPNNFNKPSEFEITFIKNEVMYQYGFVLDVNQIFEEWLFAYPFGKAQRWFSRVYDTENKKYSWSFSKFFKGGNQVKDLTLKNVLFLSNAVKLNNQQLIPVYDWFQNDLMLIDSANTRTFNFKASIELLKTPEGKNELLKMMTTADPSIADIKLDLKKPNEEEIKLPSTMPPEIQNYFKQEIMNKDHPIIHFSHAENILLDLMEESDGTRRLLAFAGKWINAIKNGSVLIVDELDNSLHPLIVRFLVKLICNPETNKNNAQLIFSTHDTSLLDSDAFRRDQIWFVEKDELNSTRLYPLLEFSPRKHEAIGKGYLQGRYGALPYIGQWMF